MNEASQIAETPTPDRLPLRAWALEFARRWNGGLYSTFVLHGNVFDVFTVKQDESTTYVPLKDFLAHRMFPERGLLFYYDISDGLMIVGSKEMRRRFFEWLELFDTTERTNFHEQGLPREFFRLIPMFRRFFQTVLENKEKWNLISLIIAFPEKLIPAGEEISATQEERLNLVTLLKWAAAPELRNQDLGVILVTESVQELHADLLQSPYVAQVRIDLPDIDERLSYLRSDEPKAIGRGKPLTEWSDLSVEELAGRTSGLNLLRIQHLLAEAVRTGEARVTSEYVSRSKKRLIEEYCQGLVRFKDPKPGVTLDRVATHTAAKKKLRDLAWLIKNGKTDVLERGVLVPGRVGVGKSFLIDCFASECGLPVMEIGEFRSKWVGDTERQQMRILLTIRALGPVIVVVDEADAVFGNRENDGDSGVSSRVFAAFAAHIGDASLRGRELWVAMTSRPDLLAIDMKRQGRFGLCVPLFPAQGPEDVVDLFKTIAGVRKIALGESIVAFIREHLGSRPLTGSDIESILIRAKECAVLAKRDNDVQLADLQQAIESFIDPLDPNLLALQELAAVLACSDRRYLPEQFQNTDRATLNEAFAQLKAKLMR